MAYVLAVIPGFLKEARIPEGGLYTAVCLIAMTGTLMHALLSKLPVATAPGLGLTVFFVSTVVGRMGYTWQQGLAAVTYFRCCTYTCDSLFSQKNCAGWTAGKYKNCNYSRSRTFL